VNVEGTKGETSKATEEGSEKKKSSRTAPADLGEMLLKTTSGDIQPFAVEGLFIDPSVFKGLLPIEEPEILKLKPSELYEKIRAVVKNRYGLTLPAKQSELRCLQ
jgi:hypothetical protein